VTSRGPVTFSGSTLLQADEVWLKDRSRELAVPRTSSQFNRRVMIVSCELQRRTGLNKGTAKEKQRLESSDT